MSYTVLNWYTARRSRKSMRELVMAELTDKPTLLAIVSDMYTQELHLRPFAPIAERFEGRLDVILCAEWQQDSREKDGEQLLAALGLATEARPRLLRDQGEVRVGVVLRAKQPIALIDLYFKERAPPGPMYPPDEAGDAIHANREERAFVQLSQLLTRLPAQPPPPPPAPLLAAGQHDFNRGGVCRLCGDGPMSKRTCPGTRVQEPGRDRFELIELD
jgi:hypothetical protein